MKKVAILQSNYIPWKGYFDLINMVDEFILYDDVQYTRRDWRNRNLIKTPEGTKWLTIPVEVKGKYTQRICDTRIVNTGWAKEHWKTIQTTYARAPQFRAFESFFGELYLNANQEYLSELNYCFLTAICGLLGIKTRITRSSDYALSDGKNERLIGLCLQAGANHYISGPAAKSYLDESEFAAANLSLSYIDYGGYPEYEQLYPPFEHGVTILDLIFCKGSEATQYMKSFA